MNGIPEHEPIPAASGENEAIEQARYLWAREYRATLDAGREVPVVDVPREIGAAAHYSVEATTELARRGSARTFGVAVDLRAMEAARRAREAGKKTPSRRKRQGRSRGRGRK